MSEVLVRQSRQDIQKGSKSFSLASFFFSQQQKEAAWKLYSWCRYCDDVIDHAESLPEAQRQIEILIAKTKNCYLGKPAAEHPWPAFYQVITDYNIPQKYPQDLLRGFRMDSLGANITNRDVLFDYCYCVAGAVGLMMCHIMGLNATTALQNAVDLGRAMQLTNIARDVHEDFKNHRVYLPTTWLQEFGLSKANFFEPENRNLLSQVVYKLIEEAEKLYVSGLEGLRFLPLRSAWAVSIALHVYREIGEQVLLQKNYEQRVIISFPRKLFLLCKATFKLLPLTATRLFKPWKSDSQIGLWTERNSNSL